MNGGACGCLKPEIDGEPGWWINGGLSRFGTFVVGGGGGAKTFRMYSKVTLQQLVDCVVIIIIPPSWTW